ncbi:uncharacterized protein LTR77_009751 [Saxophila tyrrhenica]|uniref:Uncharacterized protein n=1 Tax=Saxophila tyrrhenica TaxID=1690608 RepID=A0AAV9NXP1_9PEZI|nr:hypothetical protein LTR77_009751 [Saxophila tyrrhenica]
MDPPPSPYKFPPREGQPLQTLPAERVNGTRAPTISTSTTSTSHKSAYSDMEPREYFATPNGSPVRRAKVVEASTPTGKNAGFALPQSPSLPEMHGLKSHVRTNSDVQGLVKRFEHLDVRDKDAENVERRHRHEAELRRAQIAREEAESDVKRLREEVRRIKKEGEESRERERKVAKRLEVVMEEFGASREAHDSQHGIYEKELRKARKEAFKSSSAVLKLQEELKSTRNTLRVAQSGLDLEKQKLQQKEQARFEMEYRLIPMQEEVEKLKQKLRVVEEEREALKTSLKEEEVARVAAEGMIALPASQDIDLDLASSPRKPLSPLKNIVLNDADEDKENMHSPSKKAVESKRLGEELLMERKRRAHAEDLIDFMRAECMFQCCGCKTAARLGHQFTLELDAELAAGVERIRAGMEGILNIQEEPCVEDGADAEMSLEPATKTMAQESPEFGSEDMEIELEMTPDGAEESAELRRENVPAAVDAEAREESDDRSMTMTAESPRQTQAPNDQLLAEDVDAFKSSVEIADYESRPECIDFAFEDPEPSEPQTPPRNERLQLTPARHQPSIRTVTTTTTVPMHFTPVATKHLPPVFDPEDTENVPPTPKSAVLPDGSEVPVFDRAAALAAIQYRRGRAKSIAEGHATPRKQMMEGVKERRDISAPALGQAAPVVVSAGKRSRSVRGR